MGFSLGNDFDHHVDHEEDNESVAEGGVRMDHQNWKVVAMALVFAAIWPLFSAIRSLISRPVAWQEHLIAGLVFLLIALIVYSGQI